MNFFDKNNEFFIIDSENLNNIESNLYGFFINRHGVYNKTNYNREQFFDNLVGRGCYVNIDVLQDSISIYQDFVGSYGLYLYKSETYFAVSNSFLLLVEHLNNNKNCKNLDLNLDFINHFLELSLETKSCTETPIKQISLLDRSANILICKSSKQIYVNNIDYQEGKYSLDSEKGLMILDEWFDFWTNFIKNIASKTELVSLDLSGGYDSRLTFLLALCSGIDMSSIRVWSINDGLHCHNEDYEIASKISDYYKFKLNKNIPIGEYVNNSLDDIINIEFYSKMCFHKEMYPQTRRYIKTLYNIRGVSGEAIRATRWDKEYCDFVKEISFNINKYSYINSNNLLKANKELFRRDFEYIQNKYSLNSNNLSGHNLLWDTQCRTHGGKSTVCDYICNKIDLSPLMDPILLQLNLNTSECTDNNLLMLTIYERYCPKLLDFPFEGNRYSIDTNTRLYAKKISSVFPYRKPNQSSNEEFQAIISNQLIENEYQINRNSPIKNAEVDNYIKNLFFTSKVKSLFTSVCDEEFYLDAANHLNVYKYHPMRYAYGIISLAILFSMVNVHNNSLLKNNSVYSKCESLKHTSYYSLNRNLSFAKKFKNYISARIDIKLITKTGREPDFMVTKLSDPQCKLSKPDWFQQQGIGYVLISDQGDIEFSCISKSDGELCFFLRGMDVRDPNNNTRIPYWINFTIFSVNDTGIFKNTENLVTHDKPYVYRLSVQANSEIKVNLSWLPTFNRV